MQVTATVSPSLRPQWMSSPRQDPEREREWRVDLAVRASPAAGGTVAPHGFAFVLDRSHFISQAQWMALRAGVVCGADALAAQDYLAMVLVDRHQRLLASPAQLGADRRWVAAQLDGEDLADGANLCGGWLRARQQLDDALWVTGQHAASTRRILLCTAGYPDTGIADRATLVELARGARHRGISTSTLAVGDHPNLPLLEGMAEAGGGRCYPVRTDADVSAAIAEERRRLGLRALRGVVLRLIPSDGVRIEPSDGGHLSQHPGGGVTMPLDELLADEERQLVVHLACQEGQWERLRAAQAPLAMVHADGERFTARGGTEYRTVLLPVRPPL